MVLGAAYALWLYRRVVFGELIKSDLKKISDVNKWEIAIFVPLVLLTLWFGIYPMILLDFMDESVVSLLAHMQTYAEIN